jgi:hypothetical protein
LEFNLKEIKRVCVYTDSEIKNEKNAEKFRNSSEFFPSFSSWAHAAIAATESQYFIEYGKLYDLSEQELVDCVAENLGCGGGG